MYKVVNTGKTDQHIPLSHGEKLSGTTGVEGKLARKIIVPGTAHGEDANYTTINEAQLRSMFGLFEQTEPGVVNPEKGTAIVIQNVTRNRNLLDDGRLVVLDGDGHFIFGRGTKDFQAKVVEETMKENQDLKDQQARFIEVLVADGFTEEDAQKILEGKMKVSDAKLKAEEGKPTSSVPKETGKKSSKVAKAENAESDADKAE